MAIIHGSFNTFFDAQWKLCQKLMRHDYLYYKEVYGALHRFPGWTPCRHPAHSVTDDAMCVSLDDASWVLED